MHIRDGIGRPSLVTSRKIVVKAIVEIRAKEVPDISRPDQPLLATSAICQPQANRRNTIFRDGWADPPHEKIRVHGALLHLLFHFIQKLDERVDGRGCRYAFDNRLHALANTAEDIPETDRFVIVDFFVRHHLLHLLLPEIEFFLFLVREIHVMDILGNGEFSVVLYGRVTRALNVNKRSTIIYIDVFTNLWGGLIFDCENRCGKIC